MRIDKFGPPEYRDGDIDFDIYFILSKSEADTITDPGTLAAITAALTAAPPPPFGAVAAAILNNYLGQIAAGRGPNGSSVKLTVRNQVVFSYFIAEPI